MKAAVKAMKTWKGIWKAVLGAAILFCLLTGGAAEAADGSVVSIAGQTVGIDIGRAAGVRRGDLYLIYADGQERRDYDGSFLGREKHNLAVIKIGRVSRASGNGNVISGHAALVQRGHRVEPISARDAKYVSFEEYRPYRPSYPRPSYPAENWGAMPPPSMPKYSMPKYSMPAYSMPPSSMPPSSMPPAPMTPPAPPASAGPGYGYPPAGPQRPPYPSYEPPQQPVPNYPLPPQQGGFYPNPHPYPPQDSAPYWPQAVDPEYIAYMNANYSTDPAAVISTYPLYTGEKNTRRVAHLNARKLRGRDAYAAYADLANSFEGDYLAAYEAGEEARRLRDYSNAQFWYEAALRVNPSYQPALNGLGRLR